jgi:WD40 repeat protein
VCACVHVCVFLSAPLTLPSTLQSLFVRCCVKSKFKVVVSQLAFAVLTGFLAQQELLLAACIINDRVMFSRVETVPSTSAAQQGLLLELVGYTPVSSVTPAQLPQLLLGVPGKGKGQGAANAQMPAFLHDELYREWLQNVVLRNFFAKEKREREAVGTSRGGKRSHVESGGNVGTPRLGMGDPLVPSVLFATLTNAHDGMACLEMDRAGEQAVGGFQDSCVRVWNLAGCAWPGEERGDGGSSSAGTFTYVHPAPQQPAVEGEASSSGSRAGTPRTSSSSSSSSGAGNKQTAGADEALPVLELRGHTSAVYGVSQEQSHSHGRLLLSCSGDRSIRLWDTNVQQSVGKYLCAGTPWDVQFSPIDYYFAAAAADRSVSVYSTDRVAQVRVMFGHASDATCLGWHPNAAILLSGSDDKTCRLWDLRTGACQRILRGCPSAVSSLVVSPNGDKVAGGTDNGTIHVWDIASGSPMALLQGHKGAVHSLAFSEAGDALVSGGADCSVRTWDMDKLPALSTGLHEVAPQHAQIPIQQPVRSMHTKFSPVFHVCYTPRNLVLAGGPFTLSGSGLSGEALQQNSRREEEVVAALGLSFARAA